ADTETSRHAVRFAIVSRRLSAFVATPSRQGPLVSGPARAQGPAGEGPMKPIRATALLLVALGLTAPALAQPVDPFEAIVADRDGAEVALRDVAVPLRNPSESELRQYLEAF